MAVRISALRTLAVLPLLTVFACDGGGDDTDDTDTGPEPVCTELQELACFDDLLIDLTLQDAVSDAAITNEVDGEDFVTDMDASAGGFQNAANNPWVYGKFTDEGLVKVDITDEEALESQEWHIAARRFIIRLNGGSSGPSCVSAAALANAEYEDVTVADADGATFFEDDYYTGTCDLINDASGLEGSPQVALSPWWTYPNCVATTNVPFIIELDTGRMLKFRVQRYYGSQQQACNNNSTPGQDSAQLRFRWSFLN
jgi:hypothetical protein